MNLACVCVSMKFARVCEEADILDLVDKPLLVGVGLGPQTPLLADRIVQILGGQTHKKSTQKEKIKKISGKFCPGYFFLLATVILSLFDNAGPLALYLFRF
jgi:hypothetical protein